MASPSGFSYKVRKSGEVIISHHGREVTVLRGRQAAKFLSRLVDANDQQLMARVTGKFKRGNERGERLWS
jgi:hypothetical protein